MTRYLRRMARAVALVAAFFVTSRVSDLGITIRALVTTNRFVVLFGAERAILAVPVFFAGAVAAPFLIAGHALRTTIAVELVVTCERAPRKENTALRTVIAILVPIVDCSTRVAV